MGSVLSVAGSAHQAGVLLCGEDGAYIGSASFDGIYIREANLHQITTYLSCLVQSISDSLGITQFELQSQCEKLAFAVSGLDSRFDCGYLPGLLRCIGFKNLREESLCIVGIAEAVFRGSLFDSPGILIRAGAGCSVFSSNRAGKSLLSTTYALPFSELGTTAKLGKDVLGCVANLMNHIADNDETEIADSAMRSSFCVDPIELYEDFQRVRFSGGNLAILRKTSDYADILFRLAQRGNLRANQLLDETSGHLYKMARRQIIELELDKSDFSILFQGTLFDKHPAMARHLSNRLAGEFVMGRQVDSETCLFTGTIGATLIALSEQREGFSLCDRGRALLSSLRDANLANNEVVYWNTIAVHTGEPV